MAGTPQPSTLRDITRDAVRARIAEVAIDLFSRRGFDAVTVEEVAQAVGMTARSFHRYFPSKEDAVLGDSSAFGELVRDVVAARPAEEPVWDSLRAAYEALLEEFDPHDESTKRILRVIGSTASLRARNMEKHLHWEAALTPVISARLTGADPDIRARAVVQASLSCWDVALASWARPAETRTPKELLEITWQELAPRPAS